MGNTKTMNTGERKKAKRASRRKIKAQFEALTKTERKAFRKIRRSDKVPFLTWYRQHEAEKKSAE